MKCDIVVTWPRSRSLASYLRELREAHQAGLVINYRVARAPVPVPERCYMVHGGRVVGYNEVIEVAHRGEGEVARVPGDPLAGFWPAGVYVVRKPFFTPLAKRVEMVGFRGWRWFDRDITTQ